MNRAFGNAKFLREVFDQHRIGFPVHGRRGQGNLESVAVNADNGCSLGSRLRVYQDDWGVVLASSQPACVRERGLRVGGHV